MCDTALRRRAVRLRQRRQPRAERTDNAGVRFADQLCWTASPPVSSNECGSPPIGATKYGYDGRGNRTGENPASGTASVLGYDQANSLVSYTHGSTNASYEYNGDGLRMSKTIGSVAAPSAWNVSGEMPLLLSDGTAAYLFGPQSLPLEQIAGSTALWLRHDQLGSTQLLTGTTDQPEAKYSYSPDGTVSASGIASTPLLFAGQYQDRESGFCYLHARDYDPATAQFLTVDPAVLGLSSLTREDLRGV